MFSPLIYFVKDELRADCTNREDVIACALGRGATGTSNMLWLALLITAVDQTANLAVLWRRENGAKGPEWDAVSCAAVLAVNHFNARDGSVVPEFAGVRPGFQLRGLYYDAWSIEATAIIAYRKAVADGAHSIVGPSRSSQAVPVSQLAAIDEVMIVSPWASSPTLSFPSVHPFFARTWPADTLTAANIMAAISGFGWRNVG